MISSTILKNFKGFKDETVFNLSKINLLTGINGKGKSSYLQSLLLIRQSFEQQGEFDQLIFNGSCVNLGTYHDVKNRDTGSEFDKNASIEGNIKRKKDLTFPFFNQEGDIELIYCELHLKLMYDDSGKKLLGKENRIYFHEGKSNIQNGRILIGHIGKHL